MISNILSDRSARWSNSTTGFNIPGVWTATKTGTTTTNNSAVVKDSLIESYSTALSTFVWNGNHDGAGFRNSGTGSGDPVRYVVHEFMERAHKEVYEPDGKWHSGDQPVQPAGIQKLTVNGKTDIWPSWFNASKNSGIAKETATFNRYNHLLATDCTAEAYKIGIEVTKVTDPITGKDTVTAPEPYNYDVTDTCDYTPPSVSISKSGTSIIATITKGSYSIAGATLYVDGEAVSGAVIPAAGGTITGYTLTGSEQSIKVNVSDSAGYVATSNQL